MLRSFRSREDLRLIAAIRALPRIDVDEATDLRGLLSRAERHGLAGVLYDALVASGVKLSADLERDVATRELAREADHEAHLAMLGGIDRALALGGLVGVSLKGGLLAQRLYPRPAARPSTDIDLLVDEHALEAATRALATVGYEPWDDPAEARFRAEHHHLHLVHPHGPPLELHFHAFRGFGVTLRSEPLIARSVAHRELQAIRGLSAEDELGYLAVHAASHRFMRLGWLYDLLLLVKRLDEGPLDEAIARAKSAGLLRPTLLAFDLLHDLFGWSPPIAIGGPRQALARAIVEEPRLPVARAATRFAYTLALCADREAARRYAVEAVASKLKLLASRG